MAAVVALVACQGDTLDPEAASSGTLRVLMRTDGATLDRDGYSYRVGSASLTLAVQDSQEIARLPATTVPVELGGIAGNCRAYTPGPDSVSIVAQQVATVSLLVVCDSALQNVILYKHWPTNLSPEVWLMRPDGTGKQFLLPNAWQPVGTPNGTELVYSDWSNGQLWVVRSDMTKARPVVPSLGGGQRNADVSPDGASVVFERSTDVTEIYRAGLNGSNVQRLTAGPADSDPRWSPDGSLIVFTRIGNDGLQRVYRVPAEGGDTVRLTEGQSCCARWSADGQRLLVRLESGYLQSMRPDGSDTVSVSTPRVDTPVEWSPDGSEVLTEALFEDHSEIWRVPLDGGEIVTIANEPVYNGPGRWLR